MPEEGRVDSQRCGLVVKSLRGKVTRAGRVSRWRGFSSGAFIVCLMIGFCLRAKLIGRLAERHPLVTFCRLCSDIISQRDFRRGQRSVHRRANPVLKVRDPGSQH